MTTAEKTTAALELNHVQSGALNPRQSPHVGVYIVLRIDDRRAGRELLRRLIPALAGTASSQKAWGSVALSFQGLKAVGVPQDSLNSFLLPFQQGMAAPSTASACNEGSMCRPLSKGDDLVDCLFAQTENPARLSSMLFATPSPVPLPTRLGPAFTIAEL